MSQEQEDLIIAMIAQAQEAQGMTSKLLEQAQALQKQAEKTHNVAEQILLGVPAEIRKGARVGSREILQEATGIAVDGLKDSAAGLREAAAEGRASAKSIRRTGLLLGAVLLAMTVVIIGLVHFVAMPVLVRGYADDLAGVKAELAEERSALARLQSETWRLELLEDSGQRVIVLPKGVKYIHNGPMRDGSGRVGIVITP